MLLVFNNEEELDYILSTLWFFGKQGLLMERWRPGFDPLRAMIMPDPIGLNLQNILFNL